MAGFDLPMRAIREQIASALDLIMQVSRMPDGRRVITQVTEVQGMEGDMILLQDIFKFRTVPGAPGAGELVSAGLRPKFLDKLAEASIDVPAVGLQVVRQHRPTAWRPPASGTAARSASRASASWRIGRPPMSGSQLAAMVFVGAGMALARRRPPSRVYQREERLADILDLPWGEKDVDLDAAVEQHSSLVENTIGVAGRLIDQVDAKGSFLTLLERSRLPVRPGEFALFVLAGGAILGCARHGDHHELRGSASVPRSASPFLAVAYLQAPDRQAQAQVRGAVPGRADADRVVALRGPHVPAVDPDDVRGGRGPDRRGVRPGRVQETRLGDPLVDALERMAKRLDVRDVDWVVQAIRIQQTVGGKLADLLHTLADFIRAREEIRREVLVLTAEGRISAWVLGALPIFLGVFIQISNPGYLDPMFQGWGLDLAGRRHSRPSPPAWASSSEWSRWTSDGNPARQSCSSSAAPPSSLFGLAQRGLAPAGEAADDYLRSLDEIGDEARTSSRCSSPSRSCPGSSSP